MAQVKRKLTVSEVAINQVAVEIKVLKIGNRQMTQAVFNQLMSERIIDGETGKLRGTPWGYVNYHADCGNYPGGDHLHIIWQRGNELRKALHYFSFENEIKRYSFSLTERIYQSCTEKDYLSSYVELFVGLEQLFIAV